MLWRKLHVWFLLSGFWHDSTRRSHELVCTPMRGARQYLLLLLVSLSLDTNHHHLIMYHKGACCINNESHMWYSNIVLTASKSTMCSLCTSCVMLNNVTPSNCIMTSQRQVMSFEQHCECHCHGTFACHCSTEEHLFVSCHVTATCNCQARHQALFQVSWLVRAAFAVSVTSLQSQLIQFPAP